MKENGECYKLSNIDFVSCYNDDYIFILFYLFMFI